MTMMNDEELEQILERLREGGMILLKDDESRENEGDLVMAAEQVTPEDINFMASQGRGLICVPITRQRAKKLHLNPMTRQNTAELGTAFTVTVDARHGISTGISAADRAHTVQVLIDDDTEPEDLVRPGHLFPLIARDGGVFERRGQTEGSVDLMRLAGLAPAAVICEVMNNDGTMARNEDLENFCEEHDIAMCHIKDIVRYRARKEQIIDRAAQTSLPTARGQFELRLYDSRLDSDHHAVRIQEKSIESKENGRPKEQKTPLVRLHSQCLTGDVFGSERCDCREQLAQSMMMIQAHGNGAIVYSTQEGRGIGLKNKLKAYELKDEGMDTVEANLELGFEEDQREYWSAANILSDLGMDNIRLLTNNPEKVEALEAFGIQVQERVPLEIESDGEKKEYLETKKEKLGHLFQEI